MLRHPFTVQEVSYPINQVLMCIVMSFWYDSIKLVTCNCTLNLSFLAWKLWKWQMASLNLSHQKDRPFKVGTPERQDLCSMKDSFTFVLTLHITLQELMNRTFTCISFLRLFLWRRHPVHFLGLYGSLKLKKTLSTLFHSMSWVLIPSNKGAVPPFFHFTSVLD